MEQDIAIFLTALITITTIIYTLYSIRLWKTTDRSAAIARQSALVSMWSELNRYMESAVKENQPHAPALQKLSGIFAEYMLSSLFHELKFKNDPNLQQLQIRIKDLMSDPTMDVEKLQWLSTFANKMKD